MYRICSLLYLVLLALPGYAQQPLSLEDAQRRAVERSRQLNAQDSAVLASREMAVAAGQLPDPVLKFGVDNLPISGEERFSLTRDSMTMRRIGVMQEFTRGQKREARVQRFEREAERSAAEKDAALAVIQRETAIAWLERYYAEALAGTIAEQLAQARLEVQAAEAAYRGARAGQSDVFAAHTTLAALEDRASEFGRRVAVAKAALMRWTGSGADEALARPPAMDAVPVEASKLESHLSLHPEIVAMTKQADVAAAEARLAQAARTPDWSVEFAYQQRGPEFSNMVSVGVSVPLPWDRGNRQDRETASKLAMAEQIRAQRDEALRAHISEVRVMLIEWHNGRERLARFERELLPLARERVRAAQAGYQGGKTSIGDLLAARRNEADMRMQAVQLDMDTARVWARLSYLIPDHAVHPGGRK